MFLIVGLGNPGKKYENTAHNAGFLAIDYIQKNLSPVFSDWKKSATKFRGYISEGIIDEKKYILLKPQTFMNLSGQSVRAIMDYYKIDDKNIIVIHDDADIALGDYKIQSGRGHAGHNGVKSIISNLNNKNNFTRVRIGIRPSDISLKASEFVLSSLSKETKNILDDVFKKITNEIKIITQK